MTIHAQGLREHGHHQVPSAEDSAGQANQILTLLDSEWDSLIPLGCSPIKTHACTCSFLSLCLELKPMELKLVTTGPASILSPLELHKILRTKF